MISNRTLIQTATHGGGPSGRRPAMQTMMATYMDQSKKMVHQMQDQLKNQSLTIFSARSPAALSAEETRNTPHPDN